MDNQRSLRMWITFAGCVLVVAVLYWAQDILVPVSLALLLMFVLAPPVMWLQRWVGRGAAVLIVVTLVFSALALAAWGIALQMDSLGTDLVTYRENIREKARDVRLAGTGGSVEKLQSTLEDIKKDIGVAEPPKGTVTEPVVVSTDTVPGFSGVSWLGPILEPVGTAAFVIVLLMFMLLEREALRDRLIGLIGHGHLALTTKAFDEAGRRVSRQLLLQTMVNVIYGSLSAGGLWLLGVPYPLFWGALGAALRFIPYIGPVIGSIAPLLMSLAAHPGWVRPLQVAGFYVVLELFTNLVLETVLYAGAAGVSQVALIISVAFWTWLWGPLGLLMAVPLTVCLVVLGKHVPGLNFMATLLSDTPALAPEYGYYQRLLAHDVGEAADVVERYVKTQPPESVYDALLVPALNYAEQDRLEERLSDEDEQAVIDATREVMADAPLGVAPVPDVLGGAPAQPSAPPSHLRVLGYATNGGGDSLAMEMLARLLNGLPITLDTGSARLMTTDVIALIREQNYQAICIADLPPSPPSKTRYLVRRLRATFPELAIVVGRWAPAALADESLQPLSEAGATHVASSLIQTRKQLTDIAPRSTVEGPEHADAA